MEEKESVLAELFLIIGGFILAETLVRWFLSLSEGLLPYGVLPALSLLLIMTAVDIKKYGFSKSGTGITSVLFLSVTIVLIAFLKIGQLSAIHFLWAILVISILTTLIQAIIFFASKRR